LPFRSDRLDPGPLYHVRNARRVVCGFCCWLKPFRGVATKHLLRYFSWYIRIAAMAPARPCRGPITLLRGPRGLFPHGPRQPKGPLAGTIATTEQRKPWSRDSVKNQQHFSRYRHFLSTSIWTEVPGGRIGLENGVRGAIRRRVIGKSMALSTVHYALLPYNAMMRNIMPARALLQCPNLSGAPRFS